VQGRGLDLGDGMKAPQRDNGDGFCIIPALLSNCRYQIGCRKNGPDAFLPKFLSQHHSPHGFVTTTRRARGAWIWVTPQLALVSHDGPTHSTLNHAKEHGLHSTIQLVVFGTLVGCLDICKDSPSNDRAQRGRRSPWEKREKSFEKTGRLAFSIFFRTER
jgi:hypothetical protein